MKKKKKFNKKNWIWIIIGIVFLIVSIFLLILINSINSVNKEPKLGDCLDVTNYGAIHTQRYCKIISIDGGKDGVWHFGLDGSTCKFYVYEYCTNGQDHPESCHNGQWYSLDGANSIDGKIVDKGLCK